MFQTASSGVKVKEFQVRNAFCGDFDVKANFAQPSRVYNTGGHYSYIAQCVDNQQRWMIWLAWLSLVGAALGMAASQIKDPHEEWLKDPSNQQALDA